MICYDELTHWYDFLMFAARDLDKQRICFGKILPHLHWGSVCLPTCSLLHVQSWGDQEDQQNGRCVKIEKLLKTLTFIRWEWLSLWDWNQPAGTFYSTAMLLPYFIYLKTKHIFSRLNSLPNNLVSLSSVTLDSSLFLFSWFISMLGFIKYLLASPFFCSHICFLV